MTIADVNVDVLPAARRSPCVRSRTGGPNRDRALSAASERRHLIGLVRLKGGCFGIYAGSIWPPWIICPEQPAIKRIPVHIWTEIFPVRAMLG